MPFFLAFQFRVRTFGPISTLGLSIGHLNGVQSPQSPWSSLNKMPFAQNTPESELTVTPFAFKCLLIKRWFKIQAAVSQILIGVCVIEYSSTSYRRLCGTGFKSVFLCRKFGNTQMAQGPQQDARLSAWKTEQSWPERTSKLLPCPLYTEIVYEQLGRPEPEKHIVV